MIGKLLSAIFTLIMGLVNVLLAPIDAMISRYLPALDQGLNYITNLFNFISNIIGYVIDASGLSDISIALVVSYWVFVLTVPLFFTSLKMALKWYNSLKI